MSPYQQEKAELHIRTYEELKKLTPAIDIRSSKLNPGIVFSIENSLISDHPLELWGKIQAERERISEEYEPTYGFGSSELTLQAAFNICPEILLETIYQMERSMFTQPIQENGPGFLAPNIIYVKPK